MKRTLFSSALLSAVIATAVGVSVAFAQATPPTFQIIEAYGIENVAQNGDLVVFVRYNLTSTDAYMATPVCASPLDVLDPCYTSLNSGTVLHTFYNGTAGGGGALLGIRNVPRIGNGLTAVYIAPGHGLVSGNTSYQTCIEGSASLFTPVPRSCLTLQWIQTADRDETRAVAPVTLTQVGRNLEDAANYPSNSVMELNRISALGAIFFVEAFPSFLQTIPDAFVVGAGRVFSDISTVPTPGALDTSIQNEAQSSKASMAMDRAARQYFSVSGNILGSWLSMVVGLIAMIGVHLWVKDLRWSSVAAVPFAAFSMWMAWTPVSVGFSALLVMLFIGSMWIFRRVPS